MQSAARTTDTEETRKVSTAARGSNQSGVRAYNERLVLSLIRQSGPMPKAEIARMTGLSAQTVSVIMRALEKEGLLRKGEPVRGRVGQPSVPMGLNQDGAFFLGLKVGRQSAELVLIDFLGKIRLCTQLAYRLPTPGGILTFANQAISRVFEQLPEAHGARIAGLGIALPFRLWDWADQRDNAATELADWRNRDIASEIGRSWDIPVFLCNDASAACGAELVFGQQDTPRDFLYFFIGFFAGGGLVLDKTLYTGKTGNAAALGSMPIVSETGKLRQLVDVASLETLESMLLEHDLDRDAIWADPDHWLLPPHILNSWLDQAANGLAQAVLASTCLIDFQCVLIDGWMPTEVRAELVRRTKLRLNDISVPGVEFPEIQEGTIGSNARSLGAASLPLSERFLVDRKAFLKG